MNITFRLASEDLEKRFVKESTAAGLDGLKGHRAVGGMRASIYNAFPEEGVDALVASCGISSRRTVNVERVDPFRQRRDLVARGINHRAPLLQGRLGQLALAFVLEPSVG